MGGMIRLQMSSRTSSSDRNSGMRREELYPMKARMTSRVTVMPRLDQGDDWPAKGRRNGTRARAVAKCPASNDTSNATIGALAVCTSGRFPIAMAVTFPAARLRRQLSCVAAIPHEGAAPRVWHDEAAQMIGGCQAGPPWYRTLSNTCCSCTAREGKPVRLRRWSATVNGAPMRRHHEPGYLKVRRVPTVETQGPGLGGTPRAAEFSGSRSGKREPCPSSAAPSWVFPLLDSPCCWRRPH